MNKLMMVMVIGLALAATGFAQERGGFGGGHFSYNGRGASGQFSGQTSRGGRYEGGFLRFRRGYGYRGPSIGFDFSYDPVPAYAYPDPYYVAPAYCPPAYYPPVVGGVVVGRGFARGRAFVGRAGEWRGFRR